MADHLDVAKEAAEARRARREKRRAVQRVVRIRRNRQRLVRGGFEVPPDLADPVESKALTPADVGLEDKMLRPADLGVEDKGDPLEGVPFGSAVAESLARAADLRASDFGFEPSGKSGYTKADVERVLGST